MFPLIRRSALTLRSTFVRALSFETIAHDHHVLANNLQRIAEADRKFVSFEPEIWDTQIAISDLEEMYECCGDDEASQDLTKKEMEKSYRLTKEMELSMALLNASMGNYSSVFLELHAGSGGEDACDWTHMLLEMYQGFAKRMNWKCRCLSEQTDGSTYRGGVLRIDGDDVSSYLSQESGVHRLVRISPFDKNNRRHTSFAAVSISPAIETAKSVSIRASDLQIDRFRSSGPGGQHVNKTESAVRLTHLPTGIVAECQAERNQHQNYEMAMELLKAKMAMREREREEKERKMEYEKKEENAWSSQIRSYVLHPYKMVKDHLFDVAESGVQKILEGDLKEFLEEVMRRKLYSDYKID